MEKIRFPEVQGIMEALRVATNGHLEKPVDLKNLSPEQISTERKYLLGKDESQMPVEKLKFTNRLLVLHKQNRLQITRSEPFGGADIYFCYGDDINRFVLRLRFGSNRPAQLSVKLPKTPANMDGYGQFNLSVRHEDIQKVHVMMHAFAGIIPASKHFVVGQSGEFWFVRDSENNLVEVVLYKVGRVEKDATSPLHLMVEIAPWGYPPPEVAVKTLEKFEAMFGLNGKQANESIAEMFG